MSELKPEQNISVEIVSGIEGLCLLVNDYRVAGPKPWGGGTVTQSFKTKLVDIERAIYGNRRAQPEITGETSDGYHTFNELYHHRAVLFSVICNDSPTQAWKSKLHHDGTMYDGMFIVGIETPDGQATYHYDIEPYWEMFNVQELPQAPEWDGHTPAQAIERIGKLRTQPENEPLTLEELRLMDGEPVYVVALDNPLENQPYWAIAGINSNDSRHQNGVSLYNRVQGDWGAFDLYGDTWLAYRSKPKEE